MQTATHPRPVRVIVEIDPSQLPSLLAQLVDRFTTHPTVARQSPTPAPDDEDEGAPALAHDRGGNLPRPVAHSPPPMPQLPPQVAKTRVLGKPCAQGHTYEGTDYNLRKRSNRGCVQCERERDLAHKRARQTERRRAALPTQGGTRPELPAHLALTAFLSPITCSDPTHRYRGLPEWTLRFLDTEDCAMCVTQQSHLALAGD